ncbi:MAG: 4-hydroxythreonine-4-phosphate dehydrogenase PdxA [Elusimicrobiota bacterium]
MAIPTLIITLGDPAGIGPEITLKAFRQQPTLLKICKPIIVGRQKELSVFDGKFRKFEIPGSNNIKIKPGKVRKGAGKIALLTLETAVKILKGSGPFTALVTSPVSKEAITEYGYPFRGHTEYLANKFAMKENEVAMVMVSDKIKVLLVTRHIPLKEVVSKLKSSDIISQVRVASKVLNPKKIFICNVNPHSGEGGKCGREETTILTPVVLQLRKNKLKVTGPLNTEKAFSITGPKDLIVCCYHDQAMAPLKLLYGMKLVNLTCGLPFIRTSPAHGTAFDIAGKNIADATSMIEAIKLAARLADEDF